MHRCVLTHQPGTVASGQTDGAILILSVAKRVAWCAEVRASLTVDRWSFSVRETTGEPMSDERTVWRAA